MIDTILFDMGGTLEDLLITEQTKKNTGKEILRMLKVAGLDPQTDADSLWEKAEAGMNRYSAYRDPLGVELKPERIWCDFILKDFDLDNDKLTAIAEDLAYMWEVTYYQRSVRPTTKAMLQGLKELGMKVGIISNTASLFQVFQQLKDYGIRDYFDDVTLSSITGYRKPHPGMFYVSLHQLQSKAENSIYVGDTISRDVIGAKNAGLAKTIQIGSFLTRLKDTEAAGKAKPDYFIEDIYEVYGIAKECSK